MKDMSVDDIFRSLSTTNMSPSVLATAFGHLAAKGVRESDPRLTVVLHSLKWSAKTLNAKSLSTALVACRKIDTKNAGLVQALCKACVPIMHTFEPQALSNTFNSLVKLNVEDMPLLEALCKASLPKLPLFNGQALANTFNALAKFNHDDKALVKAMCTAALWKAATFNSQEIAMVFNALAKFQSGDKNNDNNNNNNNNNKALLTSLCQASLTKALEFNEQELAVTLNALSKLNVDDRVLMFSVTGALCAAALPKVPRFNAVALSATFNALSKLDVVDKGLYSELLRALCLASLPQVKNFDEQSLASTFNALSKCDLPEGPSPLRDLLHALCEASLPLVESFAPRGLAAVLNSLSRLGHHDAALMSALCAAARQPSVLRLFNAQDVANTLLALASLGHRDESLTIECCRVAEQVADTFSAQGLANTLLALCIIGHPQPAEGSGGVWQALLARVPSQSWSDSDLTQLHTLQMFLDLEGVATIGLPDALRERAKAYHLSLVDSAAKSSRLHLDVSAALDEMGVQHDCETIVGGLSVDLRIRGGKEEEGQTTVIEVDGPRHFLKDKHGHQKGVVGKFKLKDRFLEAKGVRCLHVPYYEWNTLLDSEAKKNYLKKLLK